jgi:two-component system sensor histidine kinase GlrK
MRLTIFKRLTAGYLAIILMVFVFGGYVAFQLNRLTRITHLAAGVDSQVIEVVESLSTRLQILVSLEKKYRSSGNQDFYRLFQKRCHEFSNLLKTIPPMISEAPFGSLVQETLALIQSYEKGVEHVEAQADGQSAMAYTNRKDELIDALYLHLRKVHKAANLARDERIRKSESISVDVLRMTIGLAAACILLGFAVSFVTTKRIVHPLMLLQQKTRDIAAGNFVKIEKIQAPPEIRHLAEDFNTMSEKLKELDALKEDFVSHVSHNLRTPLTAIWEASEMLIRGTFDDDPDNRDELLVIVRDECKRLIGSVNRILDLSRMEAGMMDYQFVEMDLNELVHASVSKLSPIARSKMIRLHVDTQPDLPPILADSDQLHQLLENLIGNALKFTDPGGRVTLKTMPPGAAGGTIEVSITDTGCGIQHEHLQGIFSKFRRIEKGKETARGTGLGLAIAKHIVTAHGGDIWVESQKGSGSTFYFSLPLA